MFDDVRVHPVGCFMVLQRKPPLETFICDFLTRCLGRQRTVPKQHRLITFHLRRVHQFGSLDESLLIKSCATNDTRRVFSCKSAHAGLQEEHEQLLDVQKDLRRVSRAAYWIRALFHIPVLPHLIPNRAAR